MRSPRKQKSVGGGKRLLLLCWGPAICTGYLLRGVKKHLALLLPLMANFLGWNLQDFFVPENMARGFQPFDADMQCFFPLFRSCFEQHTQFCHCLPPKPFCKAHNFTQDRWAKCPGRNNAWSGAMCSAFFGVSVGLESVLHPGGSSVQYCRLALLASEAACEMR